MGCHPLRIAVIMTGIAWMLLAFAAIVCAHAPEEVNEEEVGSLSNNFSLRFSMPIDRFYRKSLVVDQSGRCELRLESNIEQPQVAAIGHYVTEIGAQEAEKLRDRVLGLADTPVPAEDTPLPSGVPMLEVIYQPNGKKQSRSFDPHIVPKRYQVIGRQILEIEKNALENMTQGLQANFVIHAEEVERERPLAITVKLVAAGAGPVVFYNPLNPPSHGFGKITLHGVRSDVPDADLQTIHRKAHHFVQADLNSDKEPPDHIEDSDLQLQPGAVFGLEFIVSLDWPPGQYQAHVTVESSGINEDEEVIVGRIIMKPQLLVVQGEKKPEDDGVADYSPPTL